MTRKINQKKIKKRRRMRPKQKTRNRGEKWMICSTASRKKKNSSRETSNVSQKLRLKKLLKKR